MMNIPSVLLIDDNADTLAVLGEFLLALGTGRVHQTPSAEEALTVLEQEEFSIIISDYRLEGMDGVQFVDQLRQRGNRTPVMMLSGAPDQQGVLLAKKHDRVDFFPKPFRITELTEAMHRLMAA
jgi:two-component system response regulator FixJ